MCDYTAAKSSMAAVAAAMLAVSQRRD